MRGRNYRCQGQHCLVRVCSGRYSAVLERHHGDSPRCPSGWTWHSETLHHKLQTTDGQVLSRGGLRSNYIEFPTRVLTTASRVEVDTHSLLAWTMRQTEIGSSARNLACEIKISAVTDYSGSSLMIQICTNYGGQGFSPHLHSPSKEWWFPQRWRTGMKYGRHPELHVQT